MQTISGHITIEDGLAGVRQRFETEIGTSKLTSHAVLHPDALPCADRETFGEKKQLNFTCQFKLEPVNVLTFADTGLIYRVHAISLII